MPVQTEQITDDNNSSSISRKIRKDFSTYAILSLVLLVVVIVLTYQPALKSEAVFFDDEEYVFSNRLVSNPGYNSLKTFFVEILAPSTVRGYYQPVSMTSLMIDYALGGRSDKQFVFHLTSLCLHIFNTLLVVALFYLLFDRFWPAFIVGLLFGLHPLNADSVVWISDRKTVVSGLFVLSSFVFYLLYVRGKKVGFYIFSLCSYVLSVLSKPTTVMLPFLFLLIDFWPLERFGKKAVLEKAVFFAVFILAVVVTILSQGSAAPVKTPSDAVFIRVPMILCHNIVFYIVKFFWPAHLTAFYSIPRPFDIFCPAVVFGFAGTAFLIIVMFVSLYRTRAVLVGFLFFFLAVLPATGVLSFTDVMVANRFMYISMLGFLLPTGSFLCFVLYRRPIRLSVIARRAVISGIVGVLVCLEIAVTYNYLTKWQNSEKLYRYMLTLTPDVSKLHNNLGAAVVERDVKAAIKSYERAIALDPDNSLAYNNLANVLIDSGRPDEAIRLYQKALTLKPDPGVRYYILYHNLGVAFAEKGDYDRAISCFKKATGMKPDFYQAYEQWAKALGVQGKTQEAIEKYKKVIELKPDSFKAYCNIGLILEQRGKIEEAIELYNKALSINPTDQTLQLILRNALSKLEKTEKK
jgi:tetratricopeptide (TPR) repeat protein